MSDTIVNASVRVQRAVRQATQGIKTKCKEFLGDELGAEGISTAIGVGVAVCILLPLLITFNQEIGQFLRDMVARLRELLGL